MHDIENDNWIKISIGWRCTHDKLSSFKKIVTETANKLGWKVFTEESKSNKEYPFYVYAAPKENGKISPVGLGNIVESLSPIMEEFVDKIKLPTELRKGHIIIENIPDSDKKRFPDRQMMKSFHGGALILEFKMADRIKLEEHNFHLANYVFRTSMYFEFEPVSQFTRLYHKINPFAERSHRKKIRKLTHELCGMN